MATGDREAAQRLLLNDNNVTNPATLLLTSAATGFSTLGEPVLELDMVGRLQADHAKCVVEVQAVEVKASFGGGCRGALGIEGSRVRSLWRWVQPRVEGSWLVGSLGVYVWRISLRIVDSSRGGQGAGQWLDTGSTAVVCLPNHASSGCPLLFPRQALAKWPSAPSCWPTSCSSCVRRRQSGRRGSGGCRGVCTACDGHAMRRLPASTSWLMGVLKASCCSSRQLRSMAGRWRHKRFLCSEQRPGRASGSVATPLTA